MGGPWGTDGQAARAETKRNFVSDIWGGWITPGPPVVPLSLHGERSIAGTLVIAWRPRVIDWMVRGPTPETVGTFARLAGFAVAGRAGDGAR